MPYIIRYTTLNGKQITMPHRIFENRKAAKAHGAQRVSEGNYQSYAVVEAAIDSKTNKKVKEGYKILPNIDRERYGERPGLEGPFRTLSGKVVYYDPREGSYYDPDTDLYLSYDEFQKYDNDYSGMKDERDIPVKEAMTLDYSRYMRSHGKKPRITGPGLFMFTTKDMGEPGEDDVFQYQGSWADAKRAAAKWAKSKGASRFYMMESNLNEAAAKIACVNCDEVSTAAAWKKNNGFCPKCKTSSQGVAESINEDISAEAHHMERDHEVQMARSDLYKTANYAIKLHSILKGISEEQGLEGWMQAKITKAADYLSSVFHALEYDELERSQSEPVPAMESSERPYVAVHAKKGKTDVTGTSSYDAAKKAAAKWGLKSTAGVDVYLADVKHTPTESVEESEDKEKIQKQIDQTKKYMKSFSGNTSSVKMKKVALQKKIAKLEAKLKELSESKNAADHRQGLIDKIKKSGAVKSGSMSKDNKKVDETTTAGAVASAPMPMGESRDPADAFAKEQGGSGATAASGTVKKIKTKDGKHEAWWAKNNSGTMKTFRSEKAARKFARSSDVGETTTAGAVASVPMPMGKTIRRRKK